MSISSSGRPAAPTRIEAPVATEEQCVSCGERNPAGTAFCLFCGTYLGWNEPGRGPTPQSTPGDSPAPVTPPGPTDTRSMAPAPEQAAPSVAARVDPSPRTATHHAPANPGTCPVCGHANDASRRFCGRCGSVLVGRAPPTKFAPTTYRGRRWWQFWGDPEERAARREYRRSLPALYRWRRILVTLALLITLGLVLALTGNNPVGWAQEKWRALTSDLEPVDNVTASASPKGTVAPPYDVSNIPGPRQGAWATKWLTGASGTDSCRRGPAEGAIVLRWDDPTRVRGLDVWAGLAADSSDRARQPHPRVLAVSFNRQCVRRELEDTPARQRVTFDTETEVDTLRVTVVGVYPSTATPAEDLVAIGGIEVLHRAE